MKIKTFMLAVAGLSINTGGVLAAGLHLQLAAGGRLAAGAGTGVTTLPSGEAVADNGHERKTCPAGSIALATSGPTTITTSKSVTTYPKGVAICLDPADFGGKAEVSDEQGIHLKPAATTGG